jgi:hypothetical protein
VDNVQDIKTIMHLHQKHSEMKQFVIVCSDLAKEPVGPGAGSSSRLKRLMCEAYQSPSLSGEVKNVWTLASIFLIHLVAWYLDTRTTLSI